MIRRPLTFALVPLALTAQLGTAHAQPSRPATPQPAAAAPAPVAWHSRRTRSRRARRATS